MLLFSWCSFHHRYRKDTKISPVESQLTVGKVNSYFLFKQQPSLWSFFWKSLFQIYEGKVRSSSSMETSESSFPSPDETWIYKEVRPKCHAQKMYIFLYCPRNWVGLLSWMLAILSESSSLEYPKEIYVCYLTFFLFITPTQVSPISSTSCDVKEGRKPKNRSILILKILRTWPENLANVNLGKLQPSFS